MNDHLASFKSSGVYSSTTVDPSSADIAAALELLTREIQDFYSQVSSLSTAPQGDLGECRDYLQQYDLENGVSLPEIMADVQFMMRTWNLHGTHPRCFGQFNPGVTVPSIIADALVALYNPQLAVWAAAPAAIEMENRVLGIFLQRFGFDLDNSIANFTSGGSEANQTALIAALTHRFPEYGERGLGRLGLSPTIYLSHSGHESFVKAAHAAGLGRASVRRVPVDKQYKIDLAALESMIEQDQQEGDQPLLVVGTAGTTALGIIDPLPELSELCCRQNVWFHVDAAWGGAAIMSEKLAPALAGIERADSITCDAHKWLSVPMAAGMFFCRHRQAVLDSFRISVDYMPRSTEQDTDPYQSTLQWSRRFIGLKVFMTLATTGVAGMGRLLEQQAELGDYLRKQLQNRGWRIVNETPLPVVCFTNDRLSVSPDAPRLLADAIVASGDAWISDVMAPDGQISLRACISNFRTQRSDIDRLISLLE